MPRKIALQIGITDAAVRGLLRQLTEARILRELADMYPKIWIADELLAVSRPARD